MTGHKHATDRKDWTFYAECEKEGEEHLRIKASAKAAESDPKECFPIDECPECGAPICYIKQEEWTEVLD